MSYQYIRFFEEIGINDIPLVGGKNASLGEMYQKLGSQGVKVPNGFAITAEAYRYILKSSNSWDELRATLNGLQANDVENLTRCGKKAREIVYSAAFPADLEMEISQAYQQLQLQYGSDLSLAIRSSATAEDLPTASFAGQQDTYLNITGVAHLLESCHRCFASLFT
ncbi:MAG: phosphoenolpyruvate synthase, partial [Methylococcales bacterium]|nr:phosphoenolpyruvate synthase [Methylococcales bacterium]